MSNASIERSEWRQIASLIFGVTGDIRYGKVEITHDARCAADVTEKFRAPVEEQPTVQPEIAPPPVALAQSSADGPPKHPYANRSTSW
jgi:hypothetical protein